MLIDTHIHLDDPQYADLEGLIKRSRAGGVAACVAPGVGRTSNTRILELAARFEGFVHPALGCHPERPGEFDGLEAIKAEIRACRDRICAVGEVGLPYYASKDQIRANWADSLRVLDEMARMARELDLPLIVHAPHGCALPALSVLLGSGLSAAVFHWHKARPEVTDRIVDAGYLVSVTPQARWRERDQRTIARVPLAQLLIETDGPWPHQDPAKAQRSGTHTAGPSEPWMVLGAAEAIATVKGITLQRVIEATADNARTLFGLGRGGSAVAFAK